MGNVARHYSDVQRSGHQFEVIFSCAAVTRIRVWRVRCTRCVVVTGMPDFEKQYKNPRPGFGDVDHKRYLRAYNYDKSRREARKRIFDKHRDLQGGSAPTTPKPGKLAKNFCFTWHASRL